MILEHRGRKPSIDPSARIAPNAVICGDVTIGPNSSIGFGVVITAESGKVTIGENCVVMDTAVIRGVRNNSVSIADNVLIGPGASVVGCIDRKRSLHRHGRDDLQRREDRPQCRGAHQRHRAPAHRARAGGDRAARLDRDRRPRSHPAAR